MHRLKSGVARFAVVAIAAYGLLWLVTERFGAPAVRLALLKELGWPADIPEEYRAPKVNQYNFRYSSYSHASAWAPFVVRMSYGRHYASEAGEGRTRICLWFFGRTLVIKDKSEWVS